jgi:hypothetical protein
MIPAKGSLVDLGKGHTSAFIWVCDMGLCMLVVTLQAVPCDLHIHREHRDMLHFRRVRTTTLKTDDMLFLEGVITGSKPHPRKDGMTEACVSTKGGIQVTTV